MRQFSGATHALHGRSHLRPASPAPRLVRNGENAVAMSRVTLRGIAHDPFITFKPRHPGSRPFVIPDIVCVMMNCQQIVSQLIYLRNRLV